MTTVRLIDGTEVRSDSEEWRAETEARAVLAKPKSWRAPFLEAVEKRRGKPAADKLKNDIWTLWRHQKNQ